MQCKGLSLVCAGLLGLMSSLPGRAAEPATPPAEALAALRAEVAALRAGVAERDVRIHLLETRNAELQSHLGNIQCAIALASEDGAGRHTPGLSPTSTLDWTSALKAATAARFMVPGAALLTVMPTGSMKPVFDERAILLTEPARFDDLRVGDIVTYKHPQYGLPVVHRILEKRGDKFWAKGDNNGRMDEVYITRQNYEARVFGIIYAREPSAQARQFTR